MININPTEIESTAAFTEKFINQTNQSVFLTGKAGTGKTTLLKKIIDSTHKNTIIVAPTGIAALNAGGVTIHSMFQLPFGGFLPIDGQPPFVSERLQLQTKSSLQKHFRMNSKRQGIFRNLELLIIDEVSMLRADLLDAMDFMLRKVRKRNIPFGGVQLLFIGDLLQLPPVVKQEEWQILKEYYEGNFFFHAKVIQEAPPLYIELDKIYRQSDPQFIEILNNLRNNYVSNNDIDVLNKYVKPNFDSMKEMGFITLTTHNAKADSMNSSALASLGSKTLNFKAEVTGDFPPHMFPIQELMELKVGAQVMFIKNDIALDKQFYNGKIGRIAALSKGEVSVIFPEEKKTITIEKYEWENVRFTLNDKSNEIQEEVIGTFVHYPLKLAWAITVHKSQGLTFEKAVIDISSVFAPGQAYVALSRLTSLNGLVLLNPIHLNGLSNDQQVVNYAKNKADDKTLYKQLEAGTLGFVQHKLHEAFFWEDVVSAWLALEGEHRKASFNSDKGKQLPWFEEQLKNLMNTLEPARKFRVQVQRLCYSTNFDMDVIYERTQAAYGYFIQVLEPVFRSTIKRIILLQRKSRAKQYVEELSELDGLMTEAILRLKRARILIENMYNGREITKETIWNAEIQNYKTAKVLIVKNEIRLENPTITEDDDAEEVITLRKSKKKNKESKKSTYDETFDLFKQGLAINEIAEKRKFTIDTIYNHLTKLISTEKIDVRDVFSEERYIFLQHKLGKDSSIQLAEMKEIGGEEITWQELKIYRASLML